MENNIKDQAQLEYAYARESMQWYGWASPIGLGIGFSLLLTSVGFFIWLLRSANII